MSLRRAFVVVCGAVLASGGVAHAGPPGGAPESAQAATLPRPLAPIRPAYPEGASGEATVRLEVVVGTDGNARSVRVVEGAPPFATAAMAAVAAARFEPGRRGDQAITARFVIEVRVAPPPAKAPSPAEKSTANGASAASAAGAAGAANGASAAADASKAGSPGATGGESATGSMSAAGGGAAKSANATGGASAAAAPIDVTVEGARGPAAAPEPAGEHLSAKAVARIPGAFGDAFRAVEILPGVVPYASGLPYFFVRGATPTTTGFYLDGVPVPLLFHVGVGPGVIAPQILAGLDFYPGGYPAMFGRQVGGILAAHTLEPAPRFSAEATLRALDAGAYVTAPLPAGRGSAFAAGRFSLTQAVLPLVTRDVNLGYWDYQAGASYRISRGERLRLLAFGADDFLERADGDRVETLYSGQFHRVDLAYERGGAPAARPLHGALIGGAAAGDEAPPGELHARVAATFGTDRTTLSGQGDLLSTLGQVRALVEAPVHRILRVRAGTDLLAEHRRLVPVPLAEQPAGDDGAFASAFTGRTVGTFGAFVDVSARPWPFLELTAGVRADFFGDPAGPAAGVDPRASARLAITPWLASVTAAGLAHQRPSFLIPLPGAVPAGDTLTLQEAVHASQSLEVTLPLRAAFRATGYLHEYAELSDFLATCGPGKTECPLGERAGGRSYGLELMLSRELTERLGGQIAYTLSRSERTVEGRSFAADTDRTHVVHVVVGYEPAPGWHAGIRVTAYSGRPYSLVAYDNRQDPERETLVGKRNVVRGPGFFRLDVRLSKTWRFGRSGFVTAVIEGLNVTLQKESIVIDCRTPVDAGQSCGPQEFGPVSIPSIGVSGGY